jgi:undecaprenyl-diphosphatase
MIEFIKGIDGQIIKFINANFTYAPVEFFFNIFTYFGYFAAGWMVFFILILVNKKQKSMWLLFAITFIVTLIISELILKNIIARSRPFIVFPDLIIHTYRETSFSCPSGHAAFSGASFYIFTKIEKKTSYKIIIFILSLLVALSRVMLKMHFPSDVVFGYFIGIAAGILVNFILKNIFKMKYEL